MTVKPNSDFKEATPEGFPLATDEPMEVLATVPWSLSPDEVVAIGDMLFDVQMGVSLVVLQNGAVKPVIDLGTTQHQCRSSELSTKRFIHQVPAKTIKLGNRYLTKDGGKGKRDLHMEVTITISHVRGRVVLPAGLSRSLFLSSERHLRQKLRPSKSSQQLTAIDKMCRGSADARNLLAAVAHDYLSCMKEGRKAVAENDEPPSFRRMLACRASILSEPSEDERITDRKRKYTDGPSAPSPWAHVAVIEQAKADLQAVPKPLMWPASAFSAQESTKDEY